MNNIMKKSIIFVLLALIAKPAYPVFGVNALSQWGMGALSGLCDGVKNNPWLTGTAVGITALVVAGHKLSVALKDENKRLAAEIIKQENQIQKLNFIRDISRRILTIRALYEDKLSEKDAAIFQTYQAISSLPEYQSMSLLELEEAADKLLVMIRSYHDDATNRFEYYDGIVNTN